MEATASTRRPSTWNSTSLKLGAGEPLGWVWSWHRRARYSRWIEVAVGQRWGQVSRHAGTARRDAVSQGLCLLVMAMMVVMVPSPASADSSDWAPDGPGWSPQGSAAAPLAQVDPDGRCDREREERGWLNSGSGLVLSWATIGCLTPDDAERLAVELITFAALHSEVVFDAVLDPGADVLVLDDPFAVGRGMQTRVWAQDTQVHFVSVSNADEIRQENVRQSRSLAASQPGRPANLDAGLAPQRDWIPEDAGWSGSEVARIPVELGVCGRSATERTWTNLSGQEVSVTVLACPTGDQAVEAVRAWDARLRAAGQHRVRDPVFGYGTDLALARGPTSTRLWAQGLDAVMVSLSGTGSHADVAAQARSFAAHLAPTRASVYDNGTLSPARVRALSWFSSNLGWFSVAFCAAGTFVWLVCRTALRPRREPDTGSRQASGVTVVSVRALVEGQRRRRRLRRAFAVVGAGVVVVRAGISQVTDSGPEGLWFAGMCLVGAVALVFWPKMSRSAVERWHLWARGSRWVGPTMRVTAQLFFVVTLLVWIFPSKGSSGVARDVPVDVAVFGWDPAFRATLVMAGLFVVIDSFGLLVQRYTVRRAANGPLVARLRVDRDTRAWVWSTLRDGCVVGAFNPVPLARFDRFVAAQLGSAGEVSDIDVRDQADLGQVGYARAVVVPVTGGDSGRLRDSLAVAAGHGKVVLLVEPHGARTAMRWMTFQKAAAEMPFYEPVSGPDIPLSIQVAAHRPGVGWRVWCCDRRTDWSYAVCLAEATTWLDTTS